MPVSIIETVLAAHKHRAETAGLNIRLCETTYQQIVVKLDRERFAQIICNIVGNSILHSHGSELVISMKVTHDTFSVRLKDNGVGISAQNQRLALQKFEQLRSSCQTSSGSGLGLAIAKGLSECMGGKLKFEDCDEGVSILVTLPRQFQDGND